MEQTESKVGRVQEYSEQLEPAPEPKISCSEETQIFKNKFYPNVSDDQWNDWRWQVRNSITSYEELKRIFNDSEYELSENLNLPLRITPYYASRITALNEGIGKCVIPSEKELIVTPNEIADSLHEKEQSPVECIVHRYPDRVLFLTTDFCSSNCRYCTRSRLINKEHISKKIWDKGIDYIKNHSEIRDVLLSGGDPLTLSDDNLEYLLKEIRNIEHVEIIRIGTKIPVVLPQRITYELCDMLKKYHPLFMNLHFSHPNELTPEVKEACSRLSDCGIPLGSQTVLLKDVNDDPQIMKKLMIGLLKIRVRPYYIYACDLVQGTSHFRSTINKGLQIISALRGYTSGLAVPQFIVDTPGGKIPLLPEYYQGKKGNCINLLNYEGKHFTYCEDKDEYINKTSFFNESKVYRRRFM